MLCMTTHTIPDGHFLEGHCVFNEELTKKYNAVGLVHYTHYLNDAGFKQSVWTFYANNYYDENCDLGNTRSFRSAYASLTNDAQSGVTRLVNLGNGLSSNNVAALQKAQKLASENEIATNEQLIVAERAHILPDAVQQAERITKEAEEKAKSITTHAQEEAALAVGRARDEAYNLIERSLQDAQAIKEKTQTYVAPDPALIVRVKRDTLMAVPSELSLIQRLFGILELADDAIGIAWRMLTSRVVYKIVPAEDVTIFNVKEGETVRPLLTAHIDKNGAWVSTPDDITAEISRGPLHLDPASKLIHADRPALEQGKPASINILLPEETRRDAVTALAHNPYAG